MTCDEALAAVALARPGRPAGPGSPDGAQSAARAHAAGCPHCAAALPAALRLAAGLAADQAPAARAGQAERTVAAAAPLLARRRAAARARRRRLLGALGAALLPLPAILILDVQIVRAVHALLVPLLPPAASHYLVGSLSALLALLLALAYAMVPLAAGRLALARSRRGPTAALLSPPAPAAPDPEEAHA